MSNSIQQQMRAVGTMTPMRAALYAALDAFVAVDAAYDAAEEKAEIDATWAAREAAGATVERMREALRESDESCAYVLEDPDSGITHAIMANGDESAAFAAREWAHDGDWDTSEGTIWVDVRVYAEWNGPDSYHERVTTQIDPDEPKCEGSEHEWSSAHDLVGGIIENPGVWGNGGGVRMSECCVICGCRRMTNTWVTRPDTGEQGLTSVSYEPGYYSEQIAARAAS